MTKAITKYKLVIISAIYFLSYGMVMNTLVMNHDSIRRMGGQALENRFAVGRFMMDPYYTIVHQNQLNPVISVTILIFCYFLSVKLIIKIFDIKSDIIEVLIHGLVISYPMTTFFFAYGQDSDAYAVSFLLSVLSVYLLKKGGKKNIILAIFAIAISLGFYQAYITITVAFLLLYYFFNGKSDFKTVKKIFFNLLYIGLGCILYYIIFKVCLVITGTQLSSYNDADSLSILNIFLTLPGNILHSYKEFYEILMKKSFLFNTQYNSVILNFSLVIVYALYLFKAENKILKCILFVLFIPAMYSAQIITGVFRQYIEFGYLIFLIGAVIIIAQFVNVGKYYHIKYSNVLFLIPSLIMVNQIYLTNQMHMKTILLTESTLDLAEQVYFDLAATPDYEYGDEVFATGNLFENENIAQNTTYKPFNLENFSKDTSWLPGFRKGFGTTRDWQSLVRVLGYEVNALNYSEYTVDEEELANSPEFPKEGYIYQADDGTFIINMGS